MRKHRRKRRKALRILFILFAVLVCYALYGLCQEPRVARYSIRATGDAKGIRIALVTDTHSCVFGEGQRKLTEMIDRQNPDVVLLGGDIIDDNMPLENSVTLLSDLGRKYLCYYVTGNHEYYNGKQAFSDEMAMLGEWGITRLSGDVADLEIKGSSIRICGMDDPCAWVDCNGFTEREHGSFGEQLEGLGSLTGKGIYTVLLTHRPERIEEYSQYSFDLVLAGHTHGGQVRIPGILNGLWAPNQGYFPRYGGGRYEENGTVMVISRGLANNADIPRIFNRPELVIIDLK